MFVAIDRRTLILRKMVERKAFHMKPKQNVKYSNEENVFMVPNHEKEGDYHVYPCLSLLTKRL